MTYYIVLEGESTEVCKYDAGILGEASKTMFYPNKGFSRLLKIINDHPEMIDGVTIYTESNKQISVEQFITDLKKFKIASR
jgi:hypothetical protein